MNEQNEQNESRSQKGDLSSNSQFEGTKSLPEKAGGLPKCFEHWPNLIR
jgi:hypothetical protein